MGARALLFSVRGRRGFEGFGTRGCFGLEDLPISALSKVQLWTVDPQGKERHCHMDWPIVEKQALAVVRQMEMNIKRPGWKHHPLAYYMAQPENEGRVREELGHKEFTFEGFARQDFYAAHRTPVSPPPPSYPRR